jgi:hypothetical protein
MVLQKSSMFSSYFLSVVFFLSVQIPLLYLQTLIVYLHPFHSINRLLTEILFELLSFAYLEFQFDAFLDFHIFIECHLHILHCLPCFIQLFILIILGFIQLFIIFCLNSSRCLFLSSLILLTIFIIF